MTLVTFNVNGKLFMIDRGLLVAKSEYFAALLDGPLQSRVNEDGTIDLIEKDTVTLAQLFYCIRNGELSEYVDRGSYPKLKLMADFYLVELPSFEELLETPIRMYAYKLKIDLEFDKYETEKICTLRTLLSDLKANRPTTVLEYREVTDDLLMKLAVSGSYESLVFEKMQGGIISRNSLPCRVIMFSKFSMGELTAAYPQFASEFVEV